MLLWGGVFLLLLMAASVLVATQGNEEFQKIAPGLEYLDLELENGARAHVFRADLSYWSPIAIVAKKGERSLATAQELSQEASAPLMLNGGFFDTSLKPLGVLISEGKILSDLRPGRDWGVLSLKDGRLSLRHTSEVDSQALAGVSFAVQCGPRIVISGEVPKLKPQSFARTALGITQDNRLLLLVTYQAPVYADSLGRAFLYKLQATDALLLDGGPSTQLFASFANFTLDRPGGTGVASGVGIKPK